MSGKGRAPPNLLNLLAQACAQGVLTAASPDRSWHFFSAGGPQGPAWRIEDRSECCLAPRVAHRLPPEGRVFRFGVAHLRPHRRASPLEVAQRS